jgi:glycolate oxidase subunit GlcD
MTQAIIDLLKTCLPSDAISSDAESLAHYGKDWCPQFAANASAIVFPQTINEVQALVQLANQHHFSLVPSGGRTGLSAGATATQKEVVVNLKRMNQILEFNSVDRTVRCQPGVITAVLQEVAKEHDLYYPVDFASSGSSHIGGNIATNAGGIKVIRYGLTRDWVVGLTVVTGAGELLHLNNGLIKNATGYDLRHLFIGSEGTLGFIVEAWIRLTKAPQHLNVLLLGVNELSSLMSVLQLFQSKITLTACEFFSHNGMVKVIEKTNQQKPLKEDCAFYILLEFEQTDDAVLSQVMELFEQAIAQGWIVDGVLSQSDTQAKTLWQLRERLSETLSEYKPYKSDVAVVPSKVPQLLSEVERIAKQHINDVEIVWWGHIGDGNLHVNRLKPAQMTHEQFIEHCEQMDKAIFEAVQKLGGSISAEHGVGLSKKKYLHYSRSPEEIAYMKAIKKVFDPNNVMNPGKIFDL